jgi:Protein  of unknown function (DUF3018)
MANRRNEVRENVAAYRVRKRAQGLREISIWVPDTAAPRFRTECRRQSALVSASEKAQQLDDFLLAAAGSVEGWE